MAKYNLYTKRNDYIHPSVGTAIGWGLELTIDRDTFPTREDIPLQVFNVHTPILDFKWLQEGSLDEEEFLNSHIIVDDTLEDIKRKGLTIENQGSSLEDIIQKGLTIENQESLNKINWCVISNNQNPEYKALAPYIIKRWNQLGIKVLYLDCYEDDCINELVWDPNHNSLDSIHFDKDDFGNVTLRLRTILRYPHDLDRYFAFMVARFWVAGHIPFIKPEDIVVISDGDLVPINKRSIFSPSYGINVVDAILKSPDLVICTNSYQNGCPMATYTYAQAKTFAKVLPTDIPSIIQDNAYRWSCKVGVRYHNDEKYMYYRYKTSQVFLKVLQNRLQGRDADLTTLRAYMIDEINIPGDLNFIELHNIRSYDHVSDKSTLNEEQLSQYMTKERWDKLFSLLEDFDRMNIAPSNYFWESIENPWRDTLITKSGELILGDEYD